MQNLSQKSVKWSVKDTSQELLVLLQKELNISEAFARVLINRRLDSPEKIKKFLHSDISQMHSPYLLKDMKTAVERIFTAIQNNEKICIYGDYDVDGTVATSILLLFFQEIGVNCTYYIPNRLNEGYSLNNTALDFLKSQHTQLIITVDNGITAHQQVEYANSLGIDVIITDHHQVEHSLPKAFAVVNPQRPDCNYPFKGICGAGVAFKMVLALRQFLRERNFFTAEKKEPNVKQFLDLLCIATVCDVVPLVDENRYFVKEGLKQINHSQRTGLAHLIKVSDIRFPVNTADIGFRIGPRLNACGRLEDPSLGVTLLTSSDQTQCFELAQLLDQLNQERQTIEKEIVEEAIQLYENTPLFQNRLGVVLYNPDWHVGVVGIVASRLVEKYNKPFFVLCQNSQNAVKGSGRSVGNISLIKALKECQDLCLNFGGHEAAAGVTLSEKYIEDFASRFDNVIKEQNKNFTTERHTIIDDTLNAKDITHDLVENLELLEPHGMGNAKPLFASQNLVVLQKRIIGKHHVKLTVQAEEQTFDMIAFKKAEEFDQIPAKIDAIFGIEFNEFQNKKSIQMVLKEFL